MLDSVFIVLEILMKYAYIVIVEAQIIVIVVDGNEAFVSTSPGNLVVAIIPPVLNSRAIYDISELEA